MENPCKHRRLILMDFIPLYQAFIKQVKISHFSKFCYFPLNSTYSLSPMSKYICVTVNTSASSCQENTAFLEHTCSEKHLRKPVICLTLFVFLAHFTFFCSLH